MHHPQDLHKGDLSSCSLLSTCAGRMAGPSWGVVWRLTAHQKLSVLLLNQSFCLPLCAPPWCKRHAHAHHVPLAWQLMWRLSYRHALFVTVPETGKYCEHGRLNMIKCIYAGCCVVCAVLQVVRLVKKACKMCWPLNAWWLHTHVP